MGPGDAKKEALLGFKNRCPVQDVLAHLPAQLRTRGLTLPSSPICPTHPGRHQSQKILSKTVRGGDGSWCGGQRLAEVPLPRPLLGRALHLARLPSPHFPPPGNRLRCHLPTLSIRPSCNPNPVPWPLAAVTSFMMPPTGPGHPRLVISELLVLKQSLILREGREGGTGTGISEKQRHYYANKGPSSQSYGFSSSHVWMWELDYKES